MDAIDMIRVSLPDVAAMAVDGRSRADVAPGLPLIPSRVHEELASSSASVRVTVEPPSPPKHQALEEEERSNDTRLDNGPPGSTLPIPSASSFKFSSAARRVSYPSPVPSAHVYAPNESHRGHLAEPSGRISYSPTLSGDTVHFPSPLQPRRSSSPSLHAVPLPDVDTPLSAGSSTGEHTASPFESNIPIAADVASASLDVSSFPNSPTIAGSVHEHDASSQPSPLNEEFRPRDPFAPSIAAALPSNNANKDDKSEADSAASHSTWAYVKAFLMDTLPRQIYLYLLLRIPSFYFSRVSCIFDEAELNMPRIKELAIKSLLPPDSLVPDADPRHGHSSTQKSLRAFARLKDTWDSFISSLIEEWRIGLFISGLLNAAILALVQSPQSGPRGLYEYVAYTSGIFAFFSLVYGFVFTVTFGKMRKAHKAFEWAEEAQRTRTSIFWNVWVFLSMPLLWLAWACILFMVALMLNIWRDRSDNTGVSLRVQLIFKCIASGILGVALLCLALIFTALYCYGSTMDRSWKRKVKKWIQGHSNLLAKVPRDATTTQDGPAPQGVRDLNTAPPGPAPHPVPLPFPYSNPYPYPYPYPNQYPHPYSYSNSTAYSTNYSMPYRSNQTGPHLRSNGSPPFAVSPYPYLTPMANDPTNISPPFDLPVRQQWGHVPTQDPHPIDV